MARYVSNWSSARSRSRLNNLMFVPLLPDDQFLDMLAASDISLVTQQKSVADIVFPSKVITLMSSARAIIASVSPGSEVARVLKEAEAGVLVAPEDPSALLDAIVALRDDPERRQQSRSEGPNVRRASIGKNSETLSVLEAHLLASRGAEENRRPRSGRRNKRSN